MATGHEQSVSKRKRPPGKYCCVMYCSKTSKDGVSLHSFPRGDREQLRGWISFVLAKRDKSSWTPGSGHICSDHFRAEDLEGLAQKELGYSKFVRVRPGAVPSIQVTPTTEQWERASRSSHQHVSAASRPKMASPTRLSTASRKLDVARMIADSHREETNDQLVGEIAHRQNDEAAQSTHCHLGTAHSMGSSACIAGEGQLDHGPTQETQLDVSCQAVVDSGSKGTQLSLKKPQRRSIGIQACRTTCDVSIQCNLGGTCEEVEDRNLVDPDPSSSPIPPPTDQDCDKDSDYAPSSDEDDNSDEEIMCTEPMKNFKVEDSPGSQKKFIVFASKLLELFYSCPICAAATEGHIVDIKATMVVIKQCCDNCGYTRMWENQPMIGRMPAGNLIMSASIFLSGSSISKALRMLEYFGIASVSKSTLYRHVGNYIEPVIVQTWERHQQDLFDSLHEMTGDLILSGDGRCDSPGYSAKYGSFTVIEQRVNKVLNVELVQSNEGRNSAWMEHIGLQRTVDVLHEAEFIIGTLITDRHKQNMAWIRDELPEATHYIDIWHVDKGLGKKIDAIAKKSDCGNVAGWKKSISNHLYWTAATTPDGDGELMKAKWKMLALHIQNVHEDQANQLHPLCGHGDLDENARNKLWIPAGSKAAVLLEELLYKKNVLKDVSMLSPQYQTSTLEAKHSLDIQFVPKHTAFSYWGMYTRLYLSALHYNENADRMQAVTEDGRPKYSLHFPKAKKGGHTIRVVKTRPTHEYALRIRDDLLQSYAENSRALKQFMIAKRADAPPTLASGFDRPDKEEAVLEFVTRYNRRTLMN